jgi:hypothetical protein
VAGFFSIVVEMNYKKRGERGGGKRREGREKKEKREEEKRRGGGLPKCMIDIICKCDVYVLPTIVIVVENLLTQAAGLVSPC